MLPAIINWWKNLLKSKALQEFEDFCSEVFTAEKMMIGKQLKDLAIAAVESLAASALSGIEKKASAMESVTTGLKQQGIVALASDISLVIEMAVTRMKNNAANNQG